MKLTINRDILLNSVRQCTLPASNTGNPVLGLVALTATKILKMGEPDSLALRATNGLTGIDTMDACAIEEEGDLAINAKQLGQIVGTMGGAVTLERKKNVLAVKSGNRRWTGQVQDASAVQLLPKPEQPKELTILGADLLTALDRVRFVVDDVGTEHLHRQGIYLDVRDPKLSAVVIGDHVVAVYVPTDLKFGEAAWALLFPKLALGFVRDLALEDPKAQILLSYDSRFAWAQSGATLLCFVPPMGEYPNWRVAYSNWPYKPVCRLPRLAVLESLRALLTTARSESAGTFVSITPDGSLALDCYDEHSEARFQDSITVTDLASPAMPTFRINAHMLRAAIDAAGGDVILNYVDTGQQIAITTDDGYVCWISLQDFGKGPPPPEPEKRKK